MLLQLTLDIWHERLMARGHRVGQAGWDSVPRIEVWAHDEAAVTPEQVFSATGCPEPHRSRWTELTSRQPLSYWRDFMAGPGSWLLSCLARSQLIVAWSDSGLDWDFLSCLTHRSWGMEAPAEAAPFFAVAAGPLAYQPRILPVEDDHFADAVAACVLFASVGLHDCFLADIGAEQVYLAHHHDQVEVFVPDAAIKERFLGQLQGIDRLLGVSLWPPPNAPEFIDDSAEDV
jgi:hypothetical protein